MSQSEALQRFFILEGVEAAGKTTQLVLLKEKLEKEGYEVITTREPGGTGIGEAIRTILLDPKYAGVIRPMTSLLLFNASRYQWMHDIVLPALMNGKVVLADRSFLSSISYQGYAEGLDLVLVRDICMKTIGSLLPKTIFLLNIGIEEMARRLQKDGELKNTRYDRMDMAVHKKIREGYLSECKEFPGLIEVVNGEAPIEEISQLLTAKILAALRTKTATMA